MKLLVLSPIDPDTIETLRKEHDVVCAFDATPARLRSLLKDRESVIFRSGVSLTAELMAEAPDLRLLVRAGSGFDNVDLDYVETNGLELVRIPQPGARAVAELTFGLMLALARKVLEADRLLRDGRWAKHELPGYLLHNKTLGIVGAGNIGSCVGQLAAAWGMKPIGCVKHPTPMVATALQQKGIRLTDTWEVLSTADFVTIHLPLNTSNRNFIDADTLSSMKPGAFLVNVSRGGIVDEHALYNELITEGRLRGAALDVHSAEGNGKVSPLAALPNTVLTPHIGATTVDTQREIGRRILSIIDSFSHDRPEAELADDLRLPSIP